MSDRRVPRPGRRAARVLARVIDVAVWIGCRVPVRLAHVLAAAGGTLEWLLRPAKRRRLATNLSHAVSQPPASPAVRALVREEIRNEARRSADLLWSLGRRDEFLATVELVGIENARSAERAGRGVVLAGTHLGGWEVATSLPGIVFEAPTTVIVADDWLAWAMEHARAAAGLEVVYPDGAALRSIRLLQAGEVVLLLGDDSRWAARTHRVRFLDSEAHLAGGVVALSRLAQAPIVAFTVLPLGPRRWRVDIDPPLDPPALRSGAEGERRVFQSLVDRWTDTISQNAEHWAASHRIDWVAGPP